MDAYCENLPKIELHAHLNGSLSEKTLEELGCQFNNVEEYQKLNKIFGKTEKTLEDCFELFKIAHNVTNNVESVYHATKCVIQDFSAENVIYLELRTTPRSESTMTKEQYIEAVVRAIIDNKNNIIVKLLLSLDRSHSKEVSEEALDLIIKMKERYPNIIRGVDLCGNPNEGKFCGDLFLKARENGLKLAIHCGEVKNNAEVKDILKIQPDRIGHGTCIHPGYGGSQDIWDLYKKLKIPTECCLTSNVVCGSSESYEKHHVQEWIKNELPFCINTDDKGVFCTSLSQEFEVISRLFNFTKHNLWKISYDTIDYTFCDKMEKDSLRKYLMKWATENTK
ncbi:unnamed protein product [Brassicogethes aeneus]|uniref:Adenosine deaminase domain-containing protein n=1 Tax=Brassicogethes aeneus TaxID=1431903 RepID=A0A9P0FGF1_BRAAE|nr:unnamed protein product [Brassicogethes aeneus]